MENENIEKIEKLEKIINGSKRFQFINDTTLEIENYYNGDAVYIDFEELARLLKRIETDNDNLYYIDDIIKVEEQEN